MALSDTDSVLVNAISAMTEVSKVQAETMQGLQEAVDRLLKAVDALPQAVKDDIDEDDRKGMEEEEAWETVRDTAQDQQKDTVESWKDELNNLLVFAGLFSAVVTAFTVESYTWLQQDPVDASNILLAQLSLQLSRFIITFAESPPSSAFTNSTAPALSLSDVHSSFSPVSYAVSVNTLWVLSLTLSLISAFFAITAQQWLRQLRLPPEMPVRRAVQLLESRKDGLTTWQVPGIISLLPLLLQIAVVFFLVGLFLLLQSLNATVTTAFGVVALVGLLAFLATISIPLITARCPYKTPLVPTIVVVLQCLSYPLAVISLPFVVSLKIFLWHSLSMSPLCLAVDRFYYLTLLPYLASFGRHMFVDLGQFWLSREHKHVLDRDEDDKAILESSSLAQVLHSIPSRKSLKVVRSLHSFRSDALLYTVHDTVVLSLRAFRTRLQRSDLVPWLKLDAKMVPHIQEWSSALFHRLLWQYLHEGDRTWYKVMTHAHSKCLIVFHELDKVFPATRQRYAKHLLRTCAQQKLSQICYPWGTIPTCLVLDLILNRGYVPDNDDADLPVSFTSMYQGNLEHHDECRLFFASIALALIVVHKSGTTNSAGITNTVNILAVALGKDGTWGIAVSDLCQYYANSGRWSQDFPELMSLAKIMEVLCEAISNYAANPLLQPSSEHLLDLSRISTSLRTICSHSAYETKPEMINARVYLITLDDRIKKAVTAQGHPPNPDDAPASDNSDCGSPSSLSREVDPNEILNESSTSDTATRTAYINNQVPITLNPTKANEEHGKPRTTTALLMQRINLTECLSYVTDPRYNIASTDRSDLPSAEHNTDIDPTAFVNDPTISFSLDKGKE